MPAPRPLSAASAAVLATVLLGCQAAPPSATGPTPGNAAAVRSPIPPFLGETPAEPARHDVSGAYGGHLLIPLAGNPKSFNPILANETSSTDVLRPAMVGSLIDYDRARDELVPGLCSGWKHSEDYKVWEFTLRKGLQWSDGHPLTADDVLFSYQLVMDDAVPNAIRSGFEGLNRPEKVEKDGDLTVRVTLQVPNLHFHIYFGEVYPLPKHILEPIWKAGKFVSDAYNVATPPDQIVVSGPYRLKEFKADQKVVLERNPYYFGVDRDGKRLPYIDQVTFVVTQSFDTSMLKFRNGEVDILAPYVYPKDYQTLKAGEAQGGYKVTSVGISHPSNFWWVNQNPRAKIGEQKLKWFRNPRFRQALAHSTDREGMVRVVLLGLGQPLWSATTPGNKRWHNPDVIHYDFDLDKAKAILDELGFKDRDGDGVREDPGGLPFSFKIHTNASNTDRVRALTILGDDLGKIGLKVVAEPIEFNALVDKLRHTYDYDAALLGLGGASPPVPMLSSNVYRSVGITHYWNPSQTGIPSYEWEARIDTLMDQINRTDKYEEMKKSFDEVQAIIAREAAWFTTYCLNLNVAVKNRVKNLHPAAVRPETYWNLEELYLDPL